MNQVPSARNPNRIAHNTTKRSATRKTTTQMEAPASIAYSQHRVRIAGWARRDSNPHAFRHVILNHARLPVPTLPQQWGPYHTVEKRYSLLGFMLGLMADAETPTPRPCSDG